MLRTRLLFKQKLHRLPNLFTLGNGFFGFASIIFASNGDLIPAAYFILFGAIFDVLDGRLARLIGITSEFGGQLDSLCDALSFCIAPAVLVYHWELDQAGFFGFMASAFFALAGLVRLARFNITKTEQAVFFLGVPSTIAGCFLATFSLIAQSFVVTPYFINCLLLLTVALGFLMISSVRFPTFKHIPKWWYAVVVMVLIMSIITLGFIKMMFGFLVLYFGFALMASLRSCYLTKRSCRKIMPKNLLV